MKLLLLQDMGKLEVAYNMGCPIRTEYLKKFDFLKF